MPSDNQSDKDNETRSESADDRELERGGWVRRAYCRAR